MVVDIQGMDIVKGGKLFKKKLACLVGQCAAGQIKSMDLLHKFALQHHFGQFILNLAVCNAQILQLRKICICQKCPDGL